MLGNGICQLGKGFTVKLFSGLVPVWLYLAEFYGDSALGDLRCIFRKDCLKALSQSPFFHMANHLLFSWHPGQHSYTLLFMISWANSP